MNLYKLVAFISFFTITLNAQMNKIEFTEFTLENGLHVILHEDHSNPIVAVAMMYHVGSKNEKPERTGMAHFFEHLLFEGSENIERGEFFNYIQNAGGLNNAYTSNDKTCYWELFPSNQLELGLWLESERLLHAKVEEIGIETQREVVKEEKRLRVDNQPYGTFIGELMKRAFIEHPYRWTVIGSLEHLNAAQEEEFMDFYKTFYVPNNAVLSIAGDINVEECKKLVNDYFAEIPKGNTEIPRPNIIEPKKEFEIRDTIYDNIQLPAVFHGFHIPAQGAQDYYAVDMLNQLLSGGESSRLNISLVEESQKAVYSGAFTFNLEDPGMTIALAMANSEENPKDIEQLMDLEYKKVQKELITDREFQKLRNQIENNFIQSNYKMYDIAENLANYHIFYGDASLINTEIDKYLAVTKEDILNVANKYYNKENRVTLYYLPKENN